MEKEFSIGRNSVVSRLGFQVDFGNGHTEPMVFREGGVSVRFGCEMGLNRTVILFVTQADFPQGTTKEEKRRIFECVVRAIWAGIPGWTIDVEHGPLPAADWALPTRV